MRAGAGGWWDSTSAGCVTATPPPRLPTCVTRNTPSHTHIHADAAAKDAAAVEANRRKLVSLLDDAEQQLATTPYLAGAAYSVADVMFTPVLFRWV